MDNDVHLNPLNVMSNLTIVQEVEFSMDDISDEVDFYVTDEVRDDVILDSESVEEIFEVIKKSKWFIQGNRTEGLLTIGKRLNVGREVNIDWKSITMGDDWDTDITDEYNLDFVLTLENGDWVLTPQ
jgi:hypothetical protein